jgi:late competence protein required for DNA uptake (superfamily II DNA/RNA helicase)
MVAEGHTVASLTGGVEGSQRDSVIDSFRSGEAKVLITTNVLARGIDVSTVSLVVNYVSLFISHLQMKSNSFVRISPRSTPPGSAHTPPTSRLTSTVLVVLVVSAVLE